MRWPEDIILQKNFCTSGAPKVFSHYTKESDERFYDNFWAVTNEWYRYSNDEPETKYWEIC